MKKLPAFFFKLDSEREPVKDFLRDLGKKDCGIIGSDIKTIEVGWPAGMPVCRSLGDGLWEVRSNISGGRVARVIFVIHEGQMCLLHGFVKKTQQTPKVDIDLAKQRMTALKRGSP